MSAIPLHIQRRCEQRWAARFVRPVALISPKSGRGERSGRERSAPAATLADIGLSREPKEKLAGVNRPHLATPG